MKTLRDYINLVDQKFNQTLSEKVTLNPDGTAPPTQTVNGVTMNAPANAVTTGSGGTLTTGNGAAVTSGTPAPAPDAAAAAKAKLTPSQLKWLGGADATDSIIMSRMPKPLPGETVPGAAPAQAAQPAAQPAAPAPSQAVNPDSQQGQMLAAQTAGMNDPASGVAGVTGGSQQDNMLAAQSAGMDSPAPAQAAQPAAQPAAKPKIMAKPDPAVMKIQQDLIAKGAKIKADGVMGPATRAAQKQFGGAAPTQAAQATQPAVYNAAKDSQAANVAPAGSFAADVAARKQAANPTGIAKEGRLGRNDHAFIDELNAMRSIAGLPTKNKW